MNQVPGQKIRPLSPSWKGSRGRRAFSHDKRMDTFNFKPSNKKFFRSFNPKFKI